MNRFLSLCLIILFNLNSIAQSTASKNVRSFEIKAKKLDTLKKIWVYLPESYDASEKKYPVIYMHDGQNLFDRETSYVGEWKVDESLDSIGQPEAIIIGIEHGGNKRIDELTPFPHDKYGGGNADAYLDFIVNELKPYVDSNYRTLPKYEHTGIFGSSLGGLVSFYATLKFPDIFGIAGIYSPSFWFSEKIYEFGKEADLNPDTKYYFLVGTEESEEMLPDLKKMISILTAKGLKAENFKINFVEGGKHNESLWSQNFADSYLWLLSNKSIN